MVTPGPNCCPDEEGIKTGSFSLPHYNDGEPVSELLP